MSHCEGKHCSCTNTVAAQSLDEMEFERGIWSAAQFGDLEKVQKLLNHHSDVNSRDSAGYTALHYASRNGHLDMCKFLVDRGADINATTRVGGATALCRASSAGNEGIVRFLLDRKADPFIQDSDGKTALHRAGESRHVSICEILLKIAPTLQDVADNKGSKFTVEDIKK